MILLDILIAIVGFTVFGFFAIWEFILNLI